MKKNKNEDENIINSYLFVIFVCLPWVIWFFIGGMLDSENYENKTMSGLPSLSLKTYESFPSDFDNYINENLPFRNYLIRTESLIDYMLFKKSSNEKVLVGKSGWLFYIANDDMAPLATYQGFDEYTEDDISSIAESCLSVQEELERNGTRFAIIFPSNKENVYPQYMPNIYEHVDKTRTDYLVEGLTKAGVNVISPKQEIIGLENMYQLYYTYDTHWNQLGAYVGVDKIFKTWGINHKSLQEREIKSYPLKDNYHESAEDDLAKMLQLRELVFNNEIEYEIQGTNIIDYDIVNEFFIVRNPSAKEERKLVLVGDSFRISMIPSLSEEFSELYIYTQKNFNHRELLKIKPDFLIYEYVERYSKFAINIEKNVLGE